MLASFLVENATTPSPPPPPPPLPPPPPDLGLACRALLQAMDSENLLIDETDDPRWTLWNCSDSMLRGRGSVTTNLVVSGDTKSR